MASPIKFKLPAELPAKCCAERNDKGKPLSQSGKPFPSPSKSQTAQLGGSMKTQRRDY